MPLFPSLTTALPVCLLALLSAFPAAAQAPHPRDHGYTTLMKGVELERQGKTEEALGLYATVYRSDSTYERVLLQRVAGLLHLERHAEALPLCDEGYALDGDRAVYFLYDKALALQGLERYDEGLATCDALIQRYPGYFAPRHLRAQLLLKKKDYAAALALLEDNARRFPFQREAHMSLAAIAQQEGRTSQAALALFTALVVRWNDARANQALSYADQLLDGKLDKSSQGVDLGQGDEFTELDLLLANRVGMSKGYKVKPDLTYAFVRQGHFLLNALKEHPQGNGFWTTYYVPFYKGLMEKGLFEGFVLHALSNSDDERVSGLAVKNKKAVDAFRKEIVPLFDTYFTTFPDSVGGTVRPVRHHYNDEGDLFAVGDGDLGNDTQTGPWTLYHESGTVSTRVTFGDDHKKTGTAWYYHVNGRLRSTHQWKGGQENGLYRSWHPNGAPADSVNVVDGKPVGPFAQYGPDGALIIRKTCTDDGRFTGPATLYLTCGVPEVTFQLVDDGIEGDGTWAYPDGRPRFAASYKAGKRNGTGTEYHLNGTRKSSYTYVDGVLEGPFTEWYVNGNKRNEGTYKADKLVGRRSTWYISGTPASVEEYDEQGREQGITRNYTEEGTLFTETEYNRGLLVRYRYYDRKGGVIAEGKRSKGRFQFEGFTPDGAKAMRGSYLDEGMKDGPWTWWWPDGTVRTEETLKAGKIDGPVRQYRPDGKLQREFRCLPGKEEAGPYTTYWPDGSVDEQGWVEHNERNGELIEFLPNGKRYAHSYYVDDKREGWQLYYDRDGVLMMEELYVDDAPRETVYYDPQGKEYQRLERTPGATVLEHTYPGGQPYSTVHYVNGKPHGAAVWYYPDGSKELEGAYVNGEQHGLWKSWHPNGQLHYENTYDLGQRTGIWRTWDIAGVLTNEETYENGLATHEKVWHPNGTLAIDWPKRNGMIHGAVTSYDMAGELQLVRYYLDGRLVGYSHNGRDGQLVDTIPLGEGVVHLRPLYANGKPSREMDLRNGELDGTYREFHTDGQLMEESPFEAGIRNGESREFFANGKPAAVTPWSNDLRHGEERSYWENGQLQDKCNWVYGQRHGERTLYDKAGKPVLVITYRDGDAIAMRKP